MRYAHRAAPAKAELDRVKRVLFPSDAACVNDDDVKEDEFHSLPLTGEEEAEARDESFVSLDEESAENMSWQSEEKPVSTTVGRIEGVFRLDPEVKVFKEKTLIESLVGESDAPSLPGVSDVPTISPSPRRFDPPFKTPAPTSSIESHLLGGESSGYCGDKTPPFQTPAGSPLNSPPLAPKVKRVLSNFVTRFGSPKVGDLSASPPLKNKSSPTETNSSACGSPAASSPNASSPAAMGKRKLFTNRSEPAEELPSPKKKQPQSKMPKIKLIMGSQSLKVAADKRKKKETAKNLAEQYRVSNREKILREMEKQKSAIDDLMTERRRRIEQRQTQLASNSPEKS